MSAERRFDGPVVVIESDDDPGDMGEPREFDADGVTYLVVPKWQAAAVLSVEWLAQAITECAPSRPGIWAEAEAIAAEYEKIAGSVAVAHKPGEAHHYQIMCRSCGQRGQVYVSVVPERAE